MKCNDYISDENHPDAGNGYIEEPFPEDKFYVRFSAHAAFLEQRYQTLFLEYGNILKAVKEYSYFGQIKLRRAAEFYIIDQLIRCNVFPNKDIEYA